MTIPLQASGLAFHRPQFALGPIDLCVDAGTIVAVVGPNGAGKTTLVQLVAGLLKPSAGSVLLAGQPAIAGRPHVLRNLGLASDELDSLPSELSATELWNLHSSAHAAVAGDRAAMRALADAMAVQLQFAPPRASISTFSHGMRKKTQLIAAMLHDPALLVLDEPTNGLDPVTAFRLGQMLTARGSQGGGVLVTTHDLAWVQRFCTHVHALSHGQVVGCGPTQGLLRSDTPASLLDQFMALVERNDP